MEKKNHCFFFLVQSKRVQFIEICVVHFFPIEIVAAMDGISEKLSQVNFSSDSSII